MYSMCIDGVTFRLENEHTKLTVMVPHTRDFPFQVIQMVGPANFLFDTSNYYQEEISMELKVPEDMVELFQDRIKDVKSVVIFYHDKRYAIDAFNVEFLFNEENGFGNLCIYPDAMSKYRMQ